VHRASEKYLLVHEIRAEFCAFQRSVMNILDSDHDHLFDRFQDENRSGEKRIQHQEQIGDDQRIADML
jgi:hypothetical protein